MRMQERVDIWNSFLMHKNLSFRVVTNKDLPTWYIILGNHRDAWVFGAVDPHSGTASLLEV
jgi:hypothetical protein